MYVSFVSNIAVKLILHADKGRYYFRFSYNQPISVELDHVLKRKPL